MKQPYMVEGGQTMPLAKDKLLELYRKMLLVRTMEETHGKLLKEGKLQLMGHFGTGQEAVSVGITGPLRQEDILFGTHRGVGEFIGKGMSPKDIWHEYLGKKTGLCKGKGTLHLADKKNNIPGLVSSLGADFSMAVGTALASKMRKTNQVTLYSVGEGTCNQADAHPSMCMAALWKLPVFFAVATNQFCELSYMCEHYPTQDVAPRAAGYGIPYEIVEGQDVEVVYEAAQKAIEHARSGKGPYLIEYKTFRMATHFTGDPGTYVNPKDLEEWAKKDPIDLCRKKLMDRGMMTAAEDQKLRGEVQAQVDGVILGALAAPDPTAQDLFEGLYSGKGVL
ncbi:MAG: thiamine pyrophosphate-dependent dehydrogenase E1 component subunit alpha [Desulfobacteraceae bacterium]|nr:MAG: thiamine pyrophosphate-dependent dehydrogenase E1 component subunit alpha [Desulfobacteraceae bacterium]